jgi:hypothetical protein
MNAHRACLLLVIATTAQAQDVHWHGYLDLRATVPGDQRSFLDGGEGRLRRGGGDARVEAAGLVLVGSAQWTPALLASATLQVQDAGDHGAELIEARLRWRPVSTARGRGWLQAGMFFPPVSLENDGIGWSSRWTLTSSAINTWVGEELRTVGVAGGYEWRGDHDTLEASVAVFGRNDPAGEILSARGWALTDVMCGLGCRLREPDVLAAFSGESLPRRYDPYREVDDRAGWHASLEWTSARFGRVALTRYDNNADGSTFQQQGPSRVFTWDTSFWALGAQAQLGDTTLVAQAMLGDTYFAPSPFFASETEYASAYALLGRDFGRWRPALRVDWFHARDEVIVGGGEGNAEHGHALTLALNFRPRPWLRLTGEVLRIDGRRRQPDLPVASRDLGDTQLQLNARLLF